MRIFMAVMLAALVATPVLADRKSPYWASLAAGEVMMRKGPGRNFPADWLYKRSGLPVKVIETYTISKSVWRKIEDPDGAQGWVQANLLSDQRTALVIGDVRAMHVKPDAAAPVVWRAEPGVVGKIAQCGNGWCFFDVRGRSGFIESAHLFGIAPGERLP